MDILNLTLNIFFSSVMEEILIVYIILLFMGNMNYFDIKKLKSNLIKIFLKVALPVAIISNILLIVFGLNLYIRFFINTIFLSIFISILLKDKDNSKDNLLKIILHSGLGILLIYILDYSTIFFLKFLFNFNILTINTSFIINLLVSLPSKIIMFSIVYIAYINKNIIVKNKAYNYKYRIIIFTQIIFNSMIVVSVHDIFTLNDTSFIKKEYLIGSYILLLLGIFLPWLIILTKKYLSRRTHR